MLKISSRTLALCVLGTAITLAGCASSGAVTSNRLTPVNDRVTDNAIARDLALIASQERRVMVALAPTTPERMRVARRALEYLALARDAY